MAKSSIFRELKIGARKLRRKVNKVRKQRKIKNRAAMAKAKQNVKKQDLIRKESRMTAAQVQREGGWTWEGAGLHPDTVMEPELNAHGQWEWVPVMSDANRRLQEAHLKQRKTAKSGLMGQTPFVVRVGGQGGIVHGGTPVTITQTAKRCGAPTEGKSSCQRLGNCPIPAHKKWRKANGR